MDGSFIPHLCTSLTGLGSKNSEIFYAKRRGSNNTKGLEACKRSDLAGLHAFIGAACCEIFVLFRSSAGPLEHDAIDSIALS